MKTCKTCKHYVGQRFDGRFHPYGWCAQFDMGNKIPKPGSAIMNVWCDDPRDDEVPLWPDDGYLRVSETFGCILHERKDTP